MNSIGFLATFLLQLGCLNQQLMMLNINKLQNGSLEEHHCFKDQSGYLT